MPRKEDLVRMTIFLRLLQHGGTLPFFANYLKTSERTIQRYIRILRESGFPIILDRQTHLFSLVSDYCVPDIEFTQSEVLAMMVLFNEYGGKINEPLFATMKTAMLKMASTVSPLFYSLVSEMAPNMNVLMGPSNLSADYGSVYETFLQAFTEKKVVGMIYDSVFEQEKIKTSLHPYTLFFHRSWYVIGFSTLHREIRTFKMSRISECSILETNYEIPISFSLESYLGNAWRLLAGQGNDQEIVIQFSPKVARNVAEVSWHKTQHTRWLDNGGVEMQFCVSGIEEILWWILGYGAEVQVIKPFELREKILEHAKRTLENYSRKR